MNRIPATGRLFTLYPILASSLMLICLMMPSPLQADDVRPAELGDLIDKADKLVVLETPRQGAKVLFESVERRDLDALKAAMKVERPKEFLHCMCDGMPALVLYANGERIAEVTNHHAKLIRCNLWKSDAFLSESEPLLRWFDDRNVPEPRKEYELGLKLEKEAKEAERKWIAAMPPALKPHWATARRSTPRKTDLAPLRKALEEKVSDKKERITALFSWYGSGEGPWSGFASYESVAEDMLLDYSTAELLAAIAATELTDAQTEGVARLFGGWAFFKLRPDDGQLLPAKLKARLLKHSLVSEDEDKRGRAQRAFSGD